MSDSYWTLSRTEDMDTLLTLTMGGPGVDTVDTVWGRVPVPTVTTVRTQLRTAVRLSLSLSTSGTTPSNNVS